MQIRAANDVSVHLVRATCRGVAKRGGWLGVQPQIIDEVSYNATLAHGGRVSLVDCDWECLSEGERYLQECETLTP